MHILSRLFEYTFSGDLVGEWRCHGMRLGGIGEPGPCGTRKKPRRISWLLLHCFGMLWCDQV